MTLSKPLARFALAFIAAAASLCVHAQNPAPAAAQQQNRSATVRGAVTAASGSPLVEPS
jgi:hypothetical protein